MSDLPVGQRVEVKYDIESQYARAYGTVAAEPSPQSGTVLVQLDNMQPVVLPFAPSELARLGDPGPNYNPSERCESGKYPHCSCDICF